MTPKGWLGYSERPGASTHQNPSAETVVLTPEVVTDEVDNAEIQQRVRTISGRPNAEVLGVRKVVDEQGRFLRFEVDIR